MISRLAHLLVFALAVAPAAACGLAGETVTVAAATAEGEIAFTQGLPVRWSGLVFASQAETALKALAGRQVTIAALGPPDRWGRRAADLLNADGRSLGLSFVLDGLARVRPETEARPCEAERREAEAAARAAGEGVWADKAGVLDADDPEALKAADGRFVFVAGRVRRVGERGARVYLDFSRAGGFALVVARKAAEGFRRAGRDLDRLAGRKVMARGVLDLSFGPRIEIADPADIELLDGAEE